jgi:3,4-dihydroxy 2-butanone 4-phosphate synthase / GTP cyclohydrolase II
MNRTLEALEAIRRGKMVILVDDEDRENEGDLVMAAELVTPEAINFMAKWGRGLICLTLTEDRLRELDIPMMVEQNTSSFGTAFTVSIEARHGVSTGISAKDRALTIQVAIDDKAKPHDLVRPGHIFPLRAKQGGVLVRTGQTEGSVDLARLAGLKSAGVICEIMNDDGSMARRPDLEVFAKEHGLIILSIAELIDYRLEHEQLVRETGRFEVVNPLFGTLDVRIFGTDIDDDEHMAIVFGEIDHDTPVLARVQSECKSGSFTSSLFCECGEATIDALAQLKRQGKGVFVELSHGAQKRSRLSDAFVALTEKQEDSATSEQQKAQRLREFGIGAQILRALGCGRIRLLTNHPKRLPGLEGYGLVHDGDEPIEKTFEKAKL